MGIDPKIWGSSAWTIIHSISFAIKTDEELRCAKHIFYSFLHVLPCDKCRINYDSHLDILPVPNEINRVARWSYDIHKRISASNDMTFSDAKKKWVHHVLTPQDSTVFLESVASSYPVRGATTTYKDNLYNYMVHLLYFLKDRELAITREDVGSKRLFKKWLQKFVKNIPRTKMVLHRQCKSLCTL